MVEKGVQKSPGHFSDGKVTVAECSQEQESRSIRSNRRAGEQESRSSRRAGEQE